MTAIELTIRTARSGNLSYSNEFDSILVQSNDGPTTDPSRDTHVVQLLSAAVEASCKALGIDPTEVARTIVAPGKFINDGRIYYKGDSYPVINKDEKEAVTFKDGVATVNEAGTYLIEGNHATLLSGEADHVEEMKEQP